MNLIDLLFIWLACQALFLGLGVLLGMMIKQADRIEQPEAETAELHVPHEWVA